MKNKLTENDPRLTAYALGELPRNEAEEITDVLSSGSNIALKKEVEQIDALGVMLAQTLGSVAGADGVAEPQVKLSANQRDAIFRSAKAPTVSDVSSANQSRWLRPMVVTLGAAALVTFAFMVLDNVDSDSPSITQLSDGMFSELSEDKLNAPITPSNKSWDASSSRNASITGNQGVDIEQLLLTSSVDKERVEDLAELVENDWVSRADSAVTRMPLVCGKASWNWVSHSIDQDEKLPNKNVIRVEEVINAFDYSVSKDLELKHVSVGVELVSCPWNDGNLIAVVAVENTHNGNMQIEAAINFSISVNKYRLIGYAASEKLTENIIAPEKITMAEGDVHIVMYEIIPDQDIENASDVLSLDIRTMAADSDGVLEHDTKTLDIQYSERAWTKANQDMQFALIAASWSQFIVKSNYVAHMNLENFNKMLTSFEKKFTPNSQQAEAINVFRKGVALVQ